MEQRGYLTALKAIEQAGTVQRLCTVDKILYVKADKDLPYAKVIDAMDIASKNGVRVVGAISEQQPGTKSTVAGDAVDMGGGKKKP